MIHMFVSCILLTDIQMRGSHNSGLTHGLAEQLTKNAQSAQLEILLLWCPYRLHIYNRGPFQTTEFKPEGERD